MCVRVRARVHRPSRHVDQSGGCEIAQGVVHAIGALVVAAHGVGQSGVGVGVHEALRDLAQSLEVGAHIRGSQGAVETDAERLAVRHGDVEGLGGLAGQRATRRVRDRAGDDQRKARGFRLLVVLLDG